MGTQPDLASSARRTVLLGMGIMVISGACTITMNTAVKYISAELHPFQIAFLRTVLGGLLLLPWLWRQGGLGSMRTPRLGSHALRGLLNAVAMLMFFYGVSRAELATATMLNFTAPLFATLLGILVLKEARETPRLLSLGLGFLGTLIILRPGFREVGGGEAAVLLAAVSWATAMIIIKRLSATESSLVITAWASVFVCGFTALPAWWVWQPLSAELLLWLLGIGALGSAAQLTLARAFSYADVSSLFPLDFLKLIWATVLGMVLFAEMPDGWTLLGGLVIFAGALGVVLPRRPRASRRAEPR